MKHQSMTSLRIRKLLTLALIVGVLQGFNFVNAPSSQAAASTGAVSSSVVSTGGGGAQRQSNCTTGSVLAGIVGGSYTFDGSSALTQLYGQCEDINSDGSAVLNIISNTTSWYGTASASVSSRLCESTSQAVAGARVWKTTNGYASGVQLFCRSLPGSDNTNVQMLSIYVGSNGSGGSNYQDISCPAGTVALGLYVYSGTIVDKFGFNCGPVINAAQSAITSVTLNVTSKSYPYSQSLSVSSVTGGGAYVISGSGFTGTTRVSIGGTAITFTLVNGTTINISGAGSAMGPVIIECSDGRFGPVPFWIFTP